MAVSDVELFKALSSAIAPVFLISGVSALLASMSTRYGRVIDRTRLVLREASQNSANIRPEDVDAELRVLYRRARLLRWTVMFAVSSIFSLAVVLFLIFSITMFGLTVPHLVPTVFSMSLVFLIVSLAMFIEDFAISLHALRREIRVALGRNVVES